MKALASSVALVVLCVGLSSSGCGRAALSPDGATAGRTSSPDGSSSTDAPGEADASGETALLGAVDARPARSPTLPDGGCFTNAFRRTLADACACGDGVPDLCEEACVDLASDDANCGACGHTCAPTSTCTKGVCGPLPTSVVTPHSGCGEMRLGATTDTLYWTDTALGRVMTMPAAGGAPARVSGAETTAPTLLAINRSTVFWLDGKTIRKRAGNVVSDVYTNAEDVHGLATSDDGATVYFSTGRKVESVPAAGSDAPVAVEVHTRGDPTALAVSGNMLVSTVNLIGVVDVIQLGGPMAVCTWIDTPDPTTSDFACNRVASSQGELNYNLILNTGSKVIWADGSSLKMGGLVVDGNQHQWDHIAYGDANVVSMAVANGVIYFNTSGAGGPPAPDFDVVAKTPMVASTDLDGPAPLRLTRKITSNVPGSLVVVLGAVYWATGDCAIQSVPTGEAP
jgi:hypothetical protein